MRWVAAPLSRTTDLTALEAQLRLDDVRAAQARTGRGHGPRRRRLYDRPPDPPTPVEGDMTEYPPEPIAIVGLAAIMPDAPDAARSGTTSRPADTASATSRRSGGIPTCTTTPTRTRRTRPTRGSAAGCATSRGTRSAGGCRCRRRSPSRWTTGSSGRSPLPAPRCSMPGWPDWDVDPEQRRRHPRQRDRRREALRHEHAHPAARDAARARDRRRRFAALPENVTAGDRRRDPQGVPRELRRDHRGHHARRARERHWPAGSPTCSTSAARTSRPTRRARRGSRPCGRRRQGLASRPVRRGASAAASTATWALPRS